MAEGFCVTSARHHSSPLSFVSDVWYQVSRVAPLKSLLGNVGRWSCQPTPETCTERSCPVPEPSHHQPRQEHPRAFAIRLHNVRTGPPSEGELGEGVLLRTDRGDIQSIVHQAPEAQHGVIWVGGARGASAGRVRVPMRGSRKRCVRKGLLPCGCATVTPTSCPNVRSISWPGSPICSRTACSVSSSSGTRLAAPWSLPRARCTSTWRASWR